MINNVPDLSSANHRPELMSDVYAIDCTPEIAERWLSRNTHNRGLKTSSIARFVEDMQSGEWTWQGGTICWSSDGVLLDGQNRLHAIVRSGVTVPVLVVTNLAPESQRDMDTGISRKLADVLALNGEANASSLAAIVRACEQWESGQRRSIGAQGSTPVSRCMAFLGEHPEIRDIVLPAKRVAASCHIPGSVIGLAWWVFSRIDDEDAEFFFERLADGQGLVKGNPIYELRRAGEHGHDKVRGERNRSYLLALTIKAWNAYRDGEEVGSLRWRAGGAAPEKFPEPR